MNKAFASSDPKKYLHAHLKSWMRGSKKYIEWLNKVEAEMSLQLAFWRDKYALLFPLQCVSIKTYYYFADNMARDLINKDESIFDMLVKYKIIADDNYSVLYKYSSDGGCYAEELEEHYTTIDITVALF